jgi:5-formyltetrahydrofolate cyclo-ligase
MSTKDAIRKKMLSQRSKIPLAEKAKTDRKFCDQLCSIATEMKAKTIHCYLPIKHEIDLWPAINLWIKNGVTVICPKVSSYGELQHLILQSPGLLVAGTFGTLYPAGNMHYSGVYDMIVVPGLAFDLQNHRIGYGKGYYDRFLQNHPTVFKIAPAYAFQVYEKLPAEPHDVMVDRVLVG